MRILHATDGSEGALAAARLLAILPLTPECRVTLLTILSHDERTTGEEAITPSREALSHSLASLDVEVRHGNAAEEILRAAEERPTDLVVVGWSGRSAISRFLVGSVTERVARHAPCAVLVARPLRAGLREVAVGVDASAGAARAIERLQQLPLPDGTEIRLITILPTVEELTRTSRLLPLPLMGADDAEAFVERLRQDSQLRLDEKAASLSAAGRRVVTDIRRGDPAAALLQAAEDQGAGLLVVGAQGHNAFGRLVLGSVTEKALRHAHCSVLVAR